MKCKWFIGVKFVFLKGRLILLISAIGLWKRVFFGYRPLFPQEWILRDFWECGWSHQVKNTIESQDEFLKKHSAEKESRRDQDQG